MRQSNAAFKEWRLKLKALQGCKLPRGNFFSTYKPTVIVLDEAWKMLSADALGHTNNYENYREII